MQTNPTLIQQFRSFCYQNSIKDIEIAIEYFTIFGGMGWSIDTLKSIDSLIEKKVLNNYKYIHADITKITNSNELQHKLLSLLALGDGREHSAFKRARVGRFEGENAIDYLVNSNFLSIEKLVEFPSDKNEEVSNKVKFNQPFMKFWFSSISPYYKGVKSGEFKEFWSNFSNIKNTLIDYMYKELVIEALKSSDYTKIGSYWDKSSSIDILIKTKDKKMIAGTCKLSNAKATNLDLQKLKDKCKTAKLDIDSYILFSKSKFSHELKKDKGKNLKLLSMRNLKSLIVNLSEDDLLISMNKRY